jgi:hypothetical protein
MGWGPVKLAVFIVSCITPAEAHEYQQCEDDTEDGYECSISDDRGRDGPRFWFRFGEEVFSVTVSKRRVR